MGEAKRRAQYNFENLLLNHIMPEDVPELIRKTAQEICGTFYEGNRSLTFRLRWLSQDVYVKLNWASFVPDAKECLTKMLTMSEAEVPLEVKEMISEVFFKMADDRRTRVDASTYT